VEIVKLLALAAFSHYIRLANRLKLIDGRLKKAYNCCVERLLHMPLPTSLCGDKTKRNK
jgi:hypothetical protein